MSKRLQKSEPSLKLPAKVRKQVMEDDEKENDDLNIIKVAKANKSPNLVTDESSDEEEVQKKRGRPKTKGLTDKDNDDRIAEKFIKIFQENYENKLNNHFRLLNETLKGITNVLEGFASEKSKFSELVKGINDLNKNFTSLLETKSQPGTRPVDKIKQENQTIYTVTSEDDSYREDFNSYSATKKLKKQSSEASSSQETLVNLFDDEKPSRNPSSQIGAIVFGTTSSIGNFKLDNSTGPDRKVFGTPSVGQLGTSSVGQLGTSSVGQLGTSSVGQLGTSSVGQLGTSSVGQLGTSSVGQLGTSSVSQLGAPSMIKFGTFNNNSMCSDAFQFNFRGTNTSFSAQNHAQNSTTSVQSNFSGGQISTDRSIMIDHRKIIQICQQATTPTHRAIMLLQELFKNDELTDNVNVRGISMNGGPPKKSLDPDRVEIIKRYSLDGVNENDKEATWKQCITAMNKKISSVVRTDILKKN